MTTELIILAAGHSRRFGAQNKQLALFEGEPLIVRTVRRLACVRGTAGGLGLTIVTRRADDEVAVMIMGLGLKNVRIIANPRATEGMATSIAAGIASLAPQIEAAVITPGDMPFISAALVERLLAAFCADGGARPTCPVLAGGTQLNPVVWPRRLFGALTALTGDTGGKSILKAESLCRVEVDGDARFADIDTPADLAALQGSARPLDK